MAIIQNITIDQDCDYTETLTVKDSTGTVVDLSNETITSTMRKTYSSATKYSFNTAKVSATDGTCTINLTDAVTAELEEGRYVYDVVVSSGNTFYRLADGNILVRPGISSISAL